MIQQDQNIIDDEVIEDSSTNELLSVFHALSHPVRLDICSHLLHSPYAVGELCELMDLKQYVVSQQLAILRKADLLSKERQSRHAIYSLKSELLKRVLRVSLRGQQMAAARDAAPKIVRPSGFAQLIK